MYAPCWYAIRGSRVYRKNRKLQVGDHLQFDYRNFSYGDPALALRSSGLPHVEDDHGHYFIREEPFDRLTYMRVLWMSP